MSSEMTRENVKEYELSNRGAALVLAARQMVVETSAQCGKAGEFVKQIAALKAEIRETFDPICEQANRAHKTATGKRAEHLAQPEEADKIAREKIGKFLAAEKKREQEAALAEQRRLQKEADDMALAEAEQLEAAGLPELAEAIIEAPPVVAPVPVQRTQMAGIAVAATWTYSELPEVCTPQSCDAEAALLEEAAEAIQSWKSLSADHTKLVQRLTGTATLIRSRTKRFYLQKDLAKIRGVVRTMKKDADQEVRGIRCYPEANLRVGR